MVETEPYRSWIMRRDEFSWELYWERMMMMMMASMNQWRESERGRGSEDETGGISKVWGCWMGSSSNWLGRDLGLYGLDCPSRDDKLLKKRDWFRSTDDTYSVRMKDNDSTWKISMRRKRRIIQGREEGGEAEEEILLLLMVVEVVT